MDIALSGNVVLFGAIFLVLLIAAVILYLQFSFKKKAEGGLSLKHAKAGKHSIELDGRTKYPEVDSFRLSGTFFNLGIAVALGLTVLAFGWTQYEKKVEASDNFILIEEDIEVEPPRTAEPPPPPPPPPPPVIEEVPEELIEEEDQPEFVDQSVEAEEEVVRAPEPVKQAAPPPPPPPPPPKDDDEIFVVVEDMPLFPGCESEPDKDARKKCSDKKVFEFVGKNLKYPVIARENGVEGTAVVQFVVDRDGSVKDASVLRDIGAGCGEEAVRVVNLMNQQGIKWTPGKQRGRPVKVQFRLPVRFKLQ